MELNVFVELIIIQIILMQLLNNFLINLYLIIKIDLKLLQNLK